jgi:hypothetical protein
MPTSRTQLSTVQTGTISNVEDHGSIIILRLKTKQGWNVPVFFDHRPLTWLLEGEGCRADDLVGRQATYDGQTLNFLK